MSVPKIPSALSHPLLEDAVHAAHVAGQELMKFFRNDMRVSDKGKANFVTEADLASERILHELLLEADPEAEMMAEESFVASTATPTQWIVDPLDGTTNFMHHIPQFAVSIAYKRDEEVEMGIVHNPFYNEWYFAVAGQGSYNGQLKMRVSKETDFRDSLFCFGFFYDRDLAMSATLRCIEELMKHHVHGIRRFGAAALDLAAVADGRYGAFFEFELQPWDMAAGILMIKEAGGRVTDCVGDSITCHCPSSLIASNGEVHTDVLAIVQKHFKSY